MSVFQLANRILLKMLNKRAAALPSTAGTQHQMKVLREGPKEDNVSANTSAVLLKTVG